MVTSKNISFVHHSIAIGGFKLELQSGNAKCGSKSAISCPVWPWNLTDGLEKQHGYSYMLLQGLSIISYIAIGQFKMELHAVRKRQIRVKSAIFYRMTLKFDRWPWKSIGHLFFATSWFVHHFITMWIQTGDTVLKRLNSVLASVTPTFDLLPVHFAWTSLLSVNGNTCNSWKFHDDTMVEHSGKGVMDGQAGGRTEPFTELLGRS